MEVVATVVAAAIDPGTITTVAMAIMNITIRNPLLVNKPRKDTVLKMG